MIYKVICAIGEVGWTLAITIIVWKLLDKVAYLEGQVMALSTMLNYEIKKGKTKDVNL